MPEPHGAAADGGYSTRRDLLKFRSALTGGKLLDRPTFELLLSPADLPPAERGRGPYGLGVLRCEAGDDIACGHLGGADGISVDFRAIKTSGWASIVMSNVGDPFAMKIGSDLAALVARTGGQDLRFPGMKQIVPRKPRA